MRARSRSISSAALFVAFTAWFCKTEVKMNAYEYIFADGWVSFMYCFNDSNFLPFSP